MGHGGLIVEGAGLKVTNLVVSEEHQAWENRKGNGPSLSARRRSGGPTRLRMARAFYIRGPTRRRRHRGPEYGSRARRIPLDERHFLFVLLLVFYFCFCKWRKVAVFTMQWQGDFFRPGGLIEVVLSFPVFQLLLSVPHCSRSDLTTT